MFGTVLVAIDGSQASYRALEAAIDVAVRCGSRLYILHVHLHGRPAEELERLAEIEHLVPEATAGVAPPSTARAAALRTLLSKAERQSQAVLRIGDLILERAKEQAALAGVKRVETYSADGDYADGILDAVDDTGADLVVMGRRGLGRMKSVVLGSVSNKVVQQVGSAVLLIQ